MNPIALFREDPRRRWSSVSRALSFTAACIPLAESAALVELFLRVPPFSDDCNEQPSSGAETTMEDKERR